MKLFKKRKAFTLLEIMLTIAIISIISAASAPVFQRLQVSNDLENSTYTVVQVLRQAKSFASASDQDSNWGLRLENNQIILFKGTSYALRDPAFDEVTALPLSLTLSGLNEIIFQKQSGLPQTTGNIILSTQINESDTISINASGRIDY